MNHRDTEDAEEAVKGSFCARNRRKNPQRPASDNGLVENALCPLRALCLCSSNYL